MNDTRKKIDVNLNSLDRLKAELLRKQEEIKKAKVEKPIEKFVPKKPEEKPKVRKEKPMQEEKLSKEEQKKKNYEEYEDSAAFEKAKRVLQAKAKFYDKMVATGGSLNSDDNCLVLFNRKKQEDNPSQPYLEDDDNDIVNDEDIQNKVANTQENTKSKDNYYIGDYSEITEDGTDWVEYTDCLGRTRKCLRKDFGFCKQQDSELAKTIQPREGVPNPLSTNQIPVSIAPGMSMSSLEAAVQSKYEKMKENWEKKETENLDKEFIHYQDVFFDEARQHGVGYYAFSTDDEERARQLKELYELRAETLEEQKKRVAEREQRDIILSERVRNAENRLRARQGLPPLEDDPVQQERKPLTKEERKFKKKEDKMKRRLERKEKEKEEERKNHIRPWDKPKSKMKAFKKKKNSDSETTSDSEASDDSEWKYKPQREPMSQEQWNERQRKIRNPDFAPPSATTSVPVQSKPKGNSAEESSSIVDNLTDDIEANSNPFFFTTKKPPPPIQKKLFVKKKFVAENNNKKMNQTEEPQIIPIRNEVSVNDYDYDIRPPGVTSDNDDDDDYREPMKKRKGAEIPPPPTFEYYGPSSGRRGPIKKPDIESSIEAGLKFLRNQSDKAKSVPPSSDLS